MVAKNPDSTAALAAFIEQRLAELGISELEACRRAELKKDAIRDIRRGSPPKHVKLLGLSRALGVSLDHLVSFLPSPPPDGKFPTPSRDFPIAPVNAPVFDAGPHDLQLVRQGASALGIAAADVPVTQIARPDSLAGRSRAYALYVPDSLNAPIIQPGHIAYVDPDRPVRIGLMCRVFPVDAAPFLAILVETPGREIVVSVTTEPAPRRYAAAQISRLERVVAIALVDA